MKQIGTRPLRKVGALFAVQITQIHPASPRFSRRYLVGLAVVTKGAAQVVNPAVWDFPGDKVPTAIVNGDVDVVVPGRPIAAQKMLDAVLGSDTWRILITHKGDTGRRFDDRPALAIVQIAKP